MTRVENKQEKYNPVMFRILVLNRPFFVFLGKYENSTGIGVGLFWNGNKNS